MFFSKEELNKADNGMSGVKGQTCQMCGLYRKVKTPKMEPFGNFKKRILVIGEAPGEEEDTKGRHWQGKAGRALQMAFRRRGFDLFEDCLNINAINCKPADNRKPTSQEVACCRARVIQVITERNPRLIILVGGTAIQSIIGHVWKKDLGGVSKWRGWQIPDRTFNAWMCPIFHPSYVEKSDSEVKTIW